MYAKRCGYKTTDMGSISAATAEGGAGVFPSLPGLITKLVSWPALGLTKQDARLATKA